jgi:hypothetical protein
MRGARSSLMLARRNQTGSSRALQTTGQSQLFVGPASPSPNGEKRLSGPGSRWQINAPREGEAGAMKTMDFHDHLGLRNSGNLLRCCRRGKESLVTDGAADDGTLRQRRPRDPWVSQPSASARAVFREEPRSLESEVPGATGADQGVSYRGARFAPVARSMARKGGGLGTTDRRAAWPNATPSRAVPPRAETAVAWHPDPAFELIPPRHQFGSVQILLMLRWILCGITLRGSCSAVGCMHQIDVEWGFDFPIPHYTTVRLWLLRVGLHKLNRPKEQASDWVWIIDHSNQIGKEKCLVILGVRVSQLPPPGKDYPLRLEQMEPIELEPVTVSDKEVVYRQLEASATRCGVPRAIIDDHGGDVAGGVELFREAHPGTIEIYDITHKAACMLKARLERDEPWKAFAAKAGQTKCNIQQTELAFLVPPSQRSKARFMNLGTLIAWGAKTLAIVDNPGPEVLQYTTRERLEEKLGWLRQFREPLQSWSEMELTIDVTVDFVRTQGLYRGAAKDLRKRLSKLSVGQSARQLGEDLEKFVADQARQVRPGERLPACSEVIETCFGKFKSLEREQAKGGFTGLLLALAACVAERTQEVVHEALQRTRTEDVIAWIRTKLGATVGSKRRVAYRASTAGDAVTDDSESETKAEGKGVAAAA